MIKEPERKIKVIVTGASGYIGRHLVDCLLKESDYSLFLLQGKDSPILFEEERVKYYRYNDDAFDIYNCLEDVKPDVVVHLAGSFVAEPKKDDLIPLIDSNFVFGVKLLDAMKKIGVKNIISTGTYWESYRQDSKYNPVDLYASLKKSFFDVLEYYVQVCDFNAVTLNLYNVYGPGDGRKKIVPLLINVGLSGKKLDVSPGDQYINLVYILDVVSAYKKAIELVLSQKINKNLSLDVGANTSIKLKELVFLIERLFSKKLNVNFGGKSYRLREIMNPKPNLEKTKNFLGWSPIVEVNEGIGKIIKELDN